MRRNLAGWQFKVTDAATRTPFYEAYRDALAARDGASAEQALRMATGFA